MPPLSFTADVQPASHCLSSSTCRCRFSSHCDVTTMSRTRKGILPFPFTTPPCHAMLSAFAFFWGDLNGAHKLYDEMLQGASILSAGPS
ncbi:Pentatricopeptide repeat-containing protein [Sesbania bispinosa]|nr:Pentatricopeptide repeat-containing protein [Sesbania bispinosa]